jgi:hypothetical protein
VRSRIIKPGVLLGDVTSVQWAWWHVRRCNIYTEWPSSGKNGVFGDLFSC